MSPALSLRRAGRKARRLEAALDRCARPLSPRWVRLHHRWYRLVMAAPRWAYREAMARPPRRKKGHAA